MDLSLLNERTRDKGITQHPKLQTIKIPKSTENVLIIPCNPSGYGFVLVDQTKEVIRDIPTQRLNITITDINKHIDQILIRKKVEESKEYNSNNILALRLLFVLAMITAFVMYVLALYDVEQFKEVYIFVPLGIIMAIVVASLIVLMVGLNTKRISIDTDSEISKVIDKDIDAENFNLYQQKGYILEKGTKFCWLSVKKVF